MSSFVLPLIAMIFFVELAPCIVEEGDTMGDGDIVGDGTTMGDDGTIVDGGTTPSTFSTGPLSESIGALLSFEPWPMSSSDDVHRS